MRRLSIARSVQVALLGLTVALATIAGFGVGALYGSRQRYEDELSSALRTQAGAARLLAAGVVEEATLRLTPEDAAGVARARAAYDAGLRTLQAQASDDARSAELVTRAGRLQQRLRRTPGGRGAPLAARQPLAQLSARQDVRAARARDRASARARRATAAIVVGGGLALLAALALVAGLVAAVRRPLGALVDAAGRLAAGEVGARVPEEDGPDELRQLAAAFNAMAADVQFAGARVEAERRRLATTVAALGDALVITGPDGRVEQANPRAAQLVPELRPGSELVPPAPLRDALMGEVVVERDGRTLAITAAHLDDGAGQVWTIRDVSERARLERMKSDFVATASHELRSPLTSIKGFVELLSASAGLSARQQEHLQIVQASTDRLVELVDDLLDVARLEAGEVRVHRRLTDVGELARDVERLLAPRVAAKGQTSVVRVPADLPRAMVDPGRLRQVLVNLLTNAHLYTEPGGRLGVELEGVDEALVLRVSDTGPGMGADEAGHVFERFHRGRQREGGPQGTGLGLSIVRSLVELHRGTVRVHSAPGEGSTFEVRLPRALERPLTAPGSAVRHGLPGRRVLVVGPDPALAALLEPFGVRAEHVATAPGRLDAEEHDALVLDLAGLGATGLELLRRVRAAPRGRLPVVLVTDAALGEALPGEWTVPRPARADALADALGAAIAAERIRVLAIGAPPARPGIEAELGALGIEHEWAVDADAVAAMCAGRHYEVALVDAGLPGAREALDALDLRGRRLRRAVLAFSAAGGPPAGGALDAEPVAVAALGAAVLGLLGADAADPVAG